MRRAALVLLAVLAALPRVAAALQGVGQTEPATFWNTLLFDAWSWEPGGVVGFGGVALWALIAFAVACIGFRSPFRFALQLAAGTAAFVTLWGAVVPDQGFPLTEIGLPAVAGLGAAWLVTKRGGTILDAFRLLVVTTVLGTFAGDVLAYGLRSLWDSPDYILVFGDRRFVDELFTVPGFGIAGLILFKVIPELVHALDDEGEKSAPAPEGPGQGDTFQVRCLRCQTDIKVDRSMKRFRVATDRFEFACPNCQYWMEWADPNAKGSAAA